LTKVVDVSETGGEAKGHKERKKSRGLVNRWTRRFSNSIIKAVCKKGETEEQNGAE
jgi:hypothetical protein